MTQEKLKQATELQEAINHLQGQITLWRECELTQITFRNLRGYSHTADLKLLDIEPMISMHIYQLGKQLTDLLIKFEQL